MLRDSSSDSEDKQKESAFEAAIDCKLLQDSMFTGNTIDDHLRDKSSFSNTINLPSQRYLDEDELNLSAWFWQDSIVTPASQKILAKKFTNLLERTYQCSVIDLDQNVPKDIAENLEKPDKMKLLSDTNCYLRDEIDNSFKMNEKKRKKPVIKRRMIEDEDEVDLNNEKKMKEVFRQLAVNGSDILNGIETKCWADKKQRKDKVFNYKRDKNSGLLKEVLPENEFTALRLKNNWDESQIVKYKRKY